MMIRIFLPLFISILFSSFVSAQTVVPPTLVLDGKILLKNRSSAATEKKSSFDELLAEAEKIVKAGKFYSVMNKVQIPPSGDKHDYMSQAPYWWADPTKPDGLPYIRRDGERNPELNKITDKDELGKMMSEAEITALAFFFTGQEKYAQHSAKLLRNWFLDPQTKMNPNLNFGQGIPGINTGRGIGIIETRDLYRVIDSAILLRESKFWTAEYHRKLKQWFADYSKWLTDTTLGKDEAKAENNHGTHYDAQLISFLLFTDQTELAKKQLEVSKNRLKKQLAINGSQPEELTRTLSWNYSFMNLHGFFTIARLAENLQADLWNYESESKGIKKAVEWLAPFAKGEKKWSHQQIKSPEMDKAYEVFLTAAEKYNNREYFEIAAKIKKEAKLTAFDLLTK